MEAAVGAAIITGGCAFLGTVVSAIASVRVAELNSAATTGAPPPTGWLGFGASTWKRIAIFCGLLALVAFVAILYFSRSDKKNQTSSSGSQAGSSSSSPSSSPNSPSSSSTATSDPTTDEPSSTTPSSPQPSETRLSLFSKDEGVIGFNLKGVDLDVAPAQQTTFTDGSGTDIQTDDPSGSGINLRLVRSNLSLASALIARVPEGKSISDAASCLELLKQQGEPAGGYVSVAPGNSVCLTTDNDPQHVALVKLGVIHIDPSTKTHNTVRYMATVWTSPDVR